MHSPRIHIKFNDRVGFVFEITRVILTWQLNILSLEFQIGSLYIQLENINNEKSEKLINELKKISGVMDISQVSSMPAEEREKKIKTVLDSVSEGILAVDVDGRITTINPVAEKIFQSSANELIGKSFAKVFSKDAPILKCLTEGKPYNYCSLDLGNNTIISNQIS